MNELLAGLVDFRGGGGWAWQRYRKLDKGFERSQAAQPRSDCPICGSEETWALGDVDPFPDPIGLVADDRHSAEEPRALPYHSATRPG
ncbi:hypothetical protein [Roseovarius sp. THAF27]|uniref:hypothetical protein n=1 Tax=Roseovarius sp. THAF27 TaxID=2587850 RepID=UPI0020C80B5A|nr:hypothetical protein [Roseovarius sp. THAF27]